MQMTDQSLRDRISLLVDAEIKGGATVNLDIPLRVVKVIPQYCTAHPLSRTISYVISARALKNGGFFFTWIPLYKQIVFENERGDL